MDPEIISSAKNVVLRKRRDAELVAQEDRIASIEKKIDLILSKL